MGSAPFLPYQAAPQLGDEARFQVRHLCVAQRSFLRGVPILRDASRRYDPGADNVVAEC